MALVVYIAAAFHSRASCAIALALHTHKHTLYMDDRLYSHNQIKFVYVASGRIIGPVYVPWL